MIPTSIRAAAPLSSRAIRPVLTCWLALVLVLLVFRAPVLRAGDRAADASKNAVVEAPAWHPFSVSVETAAAFGVNNFNDYQTLPQVFSLRYQRHPPERFYNTSLTFSQDWAFGVAVVPFTHGLENHYFGLGLGPRLIFGLPHNSPFSIYVDGRFFVGAIDSTGKYGGQGQDLTFSAISTLGVLYQVNPNLKVGAAFFYEHFSNGGLSEPEHDNIGLDTVGPSLSLSYTF